MIDFLVMSKSTPFQLELSHPPSLPIPSDHKPIGMFATARVQDRTARRRTFEQTKQRATQWGERLPTHFQPANSGAYLKEIRALKFENLAEVPPKLRECALKAQNLQNTSDQRKRALLKGLRNATNPIIRKAYQWQLRLHQARVREWKEQQRLLEWARGSNWTFAKPHKIPGPLQIPPHLDEEYDRGRWGDKLGQYMGEMYRAPTGEKRRLHEALWEIQQRACNSTQVTCDPHLLRDIIRHNVPPFRAAGMDGIPSQCLKDFGWGGICQLATLFSELTNHLDFRSDKKPQEWNRALVYMMPKEAGATSLAKHRPISLMSQVQKLYTRWLTLEVGTASETQLIGEQHGFRKCRQAPEVMHSIMRTLEVQEEWGRHVTLVKLDLQKAFDKVLQTAIVEGLTSINAHPRFTFALCRELLDNIIYPEIWGTCPPHGVPLERGCRQGAPESGMCFILAINQSLRQLLEKWEAQGFGISLGPGQAHLKTLLFVDDIILISTVPEQAAIMIQDLRGRSAKDWSSHQPRKDPVSDNVAETGSKPPRSLCQR